MNRIALFGRYLVIAGASLGVIAWLWGVLGNHRSTAIAAFVWCFIVVVTGIVLSAVFTPGQRFGLKIVAVGFAIAAIPSAVGGFLLGWSDSELTVFFWTGGIGICAGILFHGWSVVQARRDGS